MTIEVPPFIVESVGLRAACRFVTMACMLAFVFLGLSFLGHPPVSGLAGQESAFVASAGDDHCSGTRHAGATGHCCRAGLNAHACCVLPVVVRTDTPATRRGWGVIPEVRLAEIVTAPNPRPPSHLAA